jgi:hypothetical protein
MAVLNRAKPKGDGLVWRQPNNLKLVTTFPLHLKLKLKLKLKLTAVCSFPFAAISKPSNRLYKCFQITCVLLSIMSKDLLS